MNTRQWVILMMIFIAVIHSVAANNQICQLPEGKIPIRLFIDRYEAGDDKALYNRFSIIFTTIQEVSDYVFQFYGVHLILQEISFLHDSCHYQPTDDELNEAVFLGAFVRSNRQCLYEDETPREEPPYPYVLWHQLDPMTLLAMIQARFTADNCDELESLIIQDKGFLNNGIVEDGEECDTLLDYTDNVGCENGKLKEDIAPEADCSRACGRVRVTPHCIKQPYDYLEDGYCSSFIGLPHRMDEMDCWTYDTCREKDLFWGVAEETESDDDSSSKHTTYRPIYNADYTQCFIKNDEERRLPIQCRDDLVKYLDKPHYCIYQSRADPQVRMAIESVHCERVLPTLDLQKTCTAGDVGYIDRPCHYWMCSPPGSDGDGDGDNGGDDEIDPKKDKDTSPNTDPDDPEGEDEEELHGIPFDDITVCESSDTVTGFVFESCENQGSYSRAVDCFKYDQLLREAVPGGWGCWSLDTSSPSSNRYFSCTFSIECPADDQSLHLRSPCEECSTRECEKVDPIEQTPSCIGTVDELEFIDAYPPTSTICTEHFSPSDYPEDTYDCAQDEQFQSRCGHDYYCSVLDASSDEPIEFVPCRSPSFRQQLDEFEAECILPEGETCGNGIFSSASYVSGCYSPAIGFDTALPSSHCSSRPDLPDTVTCSIPCHPQWTCAVIHTLESTTPPSTPPEIPDEAYTSLFCNDQNTAVETLDGCGVYSVTVYARCIDDNGDSCDDIDQDAPVITYGDYDADTHTSVFTQKLTNTCGVQCIDGNLYSSTSFPDILSPDDKELTCDSFDGYTCSEPCGVGVYRRLPVCVNTVDDTVVHVIEQGMSDEDVFCRWYRQYDLGKESVCVDVSGTGCSFDYHCKYTYNRESTLPEHDLGDLSDFYQLSLENCNKTPPVEALSNMCGTFDREWKCRVFNPILREWSDIADEFCANREIPETYSHSEYASCLEYRCLSEAYNIDNGNGNSSTGGDYGAFTRDQCTPPDQISLCGTETFQNQFICTLSHLSLTEATPLSLSLCQTHLSQDLTPSPTYEMTDYTGCTNYRFACRVEGATGQFTEENCLLDYTDDAVCEQYDLCGTSNVQARCDVSNDDGTTYKSVDDVSICKSASNYLLPDQLGSCTNTYGCTSWRCSQYYALPPSQLELSHLTTSNCNILEPRAVCSEPCSPGFAYRKVECVSNGKIVQNSITCGRSEVRPYNAMACDLSQTSQCRHQKQCDLGDGRYVACPLTLASSCPDVCSSAVDGNNGTNGDNTNNEDTYPSFTWNVPFICVTGQGGSLPANRCGLLSMHHSTCTARDDVCCVNQHISPLSYFIQHDILTGSSSHQLQNETCDADSQINLTSISVRSTSWSIDNIVHIGWSYTGPSTNMISFYLEHPDYPSTLLHLDTARAGFFRQHPVPFSFPLDLSQVTPAILPTPADASTNNQLAKLHVKLLGKPEFDTVVEGIRIYGQGCSIGPKCPFEKGRCVNNVCQCNAGWSGDHCETPTSSCSIHLCLNGTCRLDSDARPVCDCYPGFSGVHCNRHHLCDVPQDNETPPDGGEIPEGNETPDGGETPDGDDHSPPSTSSSWATAADVPQCANNAALVPRTISINQATNEQVFSECDQCQCLHNFRGKNCDACSLLCGGNGAPDAQCSTCVCQKGYYGPSCNCRHVFIVYYFPRAPMFLTDNGVDDDVDGGDGDGDDEQQNDGQQSSYDILSSSHLLLEGYHHPSDNNGNKATATASTRREYLEQVWSRHLINEVSIDLAYPRQHISILRHGYAEQYYAAILRVDVCSPIIDPNENSEVVDGSTNEQTDHRDVMTHTTTLNEDHDDHIPLNGQLYENEKSLSFRFGNVTHFYHVFQQLRYNMKQFRDQYKPSPEPEPEPPQPRVLSGSSTAWATLQTQTDNNSSGPTHLPAVVRPPSELCDQVIEQRTGYSTPAVVSGFIFNSVGGIPIPGEFVDLDCIAMQQSPSPSPVTCHGSSRLPVLTDTPEGSSSSSTLIAILLGVLIPVIVILILIAVICYCRVQLLCCFATSDKDDDGENSSQHGRTRTRNGSNSSGNGSSSGRRKRKGGKSTTVEMSSQQESSDTSSRTPGKQRTKSTPAATNISPQVIDDPDLHPDWRRVMGPQGKEIYVNDKTMQSSTARPDSNGVIPQQDIFAYTGGDGESDDVQ